MDWANVVSNAASARVSKPRALIVRGCFMDEGACAAVARSAGAGRFHKVSLAQARHPVPLIAAPHTMHYDSAWRRPAP